MLHFLRARILHAFSLSLSLSLSLERAKKVFASVDGKESLSFFLSVKSVADARYIYAHIITERKNSLNCVSPGSLRVRLRERSHREHVHATTAETVGTSRRSGFEYQQFF